jgi:general secretion pathway protein D
MAARENAMHGVGGGQFIRPGMGVVAPSAQGATTNFSVVADERTNSLVVLASPLEMRQIKDLVQRLDIHSPNETSRIHVYHLKYAPAAEMVDVLNGLLSGGGGPSSLSPTTGRNSLGRGGSGSSFGGGFGTGFGGGGFGGGSSGYGGGSGFGGGGFSSFGGTNSSFGSGLGGSSMGGSSMGGGYGGTGGSSRGGSTSGSTTASTGGGKGTIFENPVSVTADPATNSLVISALPQDYQTLQKVIDQLDIPRVQVFVQAIIIEVNVSRARAIGVAGFAPGFGNGSVLGVGTLNFGSLQTALGNPLGLQGLGIGLASGGNFSIPGNVASSVVNAISNSTTSSTNSTGAVTTPCDVALMVALQSDQHSNLLSAPTLLTADNEEATIVVGQNLPFVGSATASSALSGQIFNSVDRQNVGISLDLIPQVSAGDYVKLDVYEEVSNVVPGTANQSSNPLGPTTTIRSASTSVLVQNHRTAVIGGLISSDVENTRQGVPFLSDIPVLGNLFSATSRSTAKDNLLVFLTPHVIHTRDDLQSLALDERQKFVRSLGRKEVNNMPVSQFQQLYQPTFNAPVSPQEDLMQSQQQGAGLPSTGNLQRLGPSGSSGTSP